MAEDSSWGSLAGIDQMQVPGSERDPVSKKKNEMEK